MALVKLKDYDPNYRETLVMTALLVLVPMQMQLMKSWDCQRHFI